MLDELVHPSVEAGSNAFVGQRWFIASRFSAGAAGLGLIMTAFAFPALVPKMLLAAAAGLAFQALVALAVSHFGGLRSGIMASLAALGLGLMPTLGGALVMPLGLFVIEAALIDGRRGVGLTGMTLVVLGMLAALPLVMLGQTGTALGLMIVAPLALAGFCAAGLALTRVTGEASRRIAEIAVRLDALDAVAGAGFAVHDRQGGVVMVGEGLAALLGQPAEALQAGDFIARLHLTSRPAFLKALSDVAHGAGEASARIRIKCAGEAFRAVDFRVIAAPDAEGGRCLLATYQPVEDEASAETERSRTERQRMDLAAASLGHELRTPLTAILGFAECLTDPVLVAEDDPKRLDYARIIAASARHMLDIVDTLPGAPRSRTPEAETVTPFPADDAVREAVAILRLSAEAAGAAIDLETEADLPNLPVSRAAFRQIVINLVSNALKFAPGTAIGIGLRQEGAALALTVRDQGQGVAADDLARLAEPFFRVRRPGAMPDGQGLGLTIVRDLVERHGGTLRIDSAPGAGTAVTVRFAHGARLIPLETHARTEPVETLPRLRRA